MFSVLLRFLFYFIFLRNNPCLIAFDSGHYHEIAKSFLGGLGFSFGGGQPQFYRLPGYPLFLAFNYFLFGVDPHFALFVQIILAGVLPILVFYLSIIFFTKDIWLAKASSVTAAIYVGFLIFSGVILSETLFMFFLMLFWVVFLNSVFKSGFQKNILSIFFIGLNFGVCFTCKAKCR